MNEITVPHSVLFPDLFEKPLVATFDQPHASSDGGAVLLAAIDQRRIAIVAVGVATISRFEHAATHGTLYRMAEALADTVIARHRPRLSEGAADYDRSRCDRRPDARRAATGVLQWFLRLVVLSGAGRHAHV